LDGAPLSEEGDEEARDPSRPRPSNSPAQLLEIGLLEMWSHTGISERRLQYKRSSEFIEAMLDASNVAEANEGNNQTTDGEPNGGGGAERSAGGGANMAEKLEKEFTDPIELVGRRVAGYGGFSDRHAILM
jgi:hypothetical protein